MDGFEIVKLGFERREEEVEKMPMDFAPYRLIMWWQYEENELPFGDELGEDCKESKCPSTNNSYYHTTFWARLLSPLMMTC